MLLWPNLVRPSVVSMPSIALKRQVRIELTWLSEISGCIATAGTTVRTALAVGAYVVGVLRANLAHEHLKNLAVLHKPSI